MVRLVGNRRSRGDIRLLRMVRMVWPRTQWIFRMVGLVWLDWTERVLRDQRGFGVLRLERVVRMDRALGVLGHQRGFGVQRMVRMERMDWKERVLRNLRVLGHQRAVRVLRLERLVRVDRHLRIQWMVRVVWKRLLWMERMVRMDGEERLLRPIGILGLERMVRVDGAERVLGMVGMVLTFWVLRMVGMERRGWGWRGTTPSAPYAQGTAASTCATGAWTSLISIGIQPGNSVNPFLAIGGFMFSYGANAGYISLRMTVNGTAADGSQRTMAAAKGSGFEMGPGLWASHLASGTSYNIAVQYSTAQAATIYDRQIGGLLG